MKWQWVRSFLQRSHVIHSTYKLVREWGEIPRKDRRRIRDIYNIWRVFPKTMLPPCRLFNIFESVRRVNAESVPGDLVECGVWSGGSSAAMAVVDLEDGKLDRRYILLDSFQGMPQPSVEDKEVFNAYTNHHPEMALRDPGDRSLSAIGACVGDRQADVEAFLVERIGIPKDKVKFYPGWFHETVPIAREEIVSIAVLRLDGDWYESTRECLEGLYHNVQPGGFVIIDDYGDFSGCRKAVDEFLAKHQILVEIEWVDDACVYFRKPSANQDAGGLQDTEISV